MKELLSKMAEGGLFCSNQRCFVISSQLIMICYTLIGSQPQSQNSVNDVYDSSSSSILPLDTPLMKAIKSSMSATTTSQQQQQQQQQQNSIQDDPLKLNKWGYNTDTDTSPYRASNAFLDDSVNRISRGISYFLSLT